MASGMDPQIMQKAVRASSFPPIRTRTSFVSSRAPAASQRQRRAPRPWHPTSPARACGACHQR